jgi:dTMP kinase
VSGWLITLEGIDGSGKSTQAQLLYERLLARGIPALLTREPGGTVVGQALRKLCLNGGETLTWETEMLLMAADRAQHVQEVIRPALEQGCCVICDRYIDSTVAYQGYGAQASLAAIRQVNMIATQGLEPHLTLLFDIKPTERYVRQGEVDRIEKRSLEYHQRVYEGFMQIARENERVVVIPAKRKTPAEVAVMVWQACVTKLPHLDRSAELN